MRTKNTKVENRNDPFVEYASTKIWQEQPSKDNPYVEDAINCHGYDLIELIKKRSYVDVVYLLFRGELPSEAESKLLEQLMIGLINPGPRHPATRAAMYAGASKTDPTNLLPIALNIYGGEVSGAAEIEPAMRFLRKNRKINPIKLVGELIETQNQPDEGDWHIVPGFGSRYGNADIMAIKLAEQLLSLSGKKEHLEWGHSLSTLLGKHNMSWLSTGLAAAVLTDLGFNPRAGAGLFQLFAAPGLLAHGAEMANKPVTAMPFVKDENYIINYEE